MRLHHRSTLTIVALLLCSAAVAATPARFQAVALSPVIGLWNASSDGSNELTIDGAKWTGQTSRDEADRAARAVFGAPAGDAFMLNATSASAFPLAVAATVPTFSNGTLRVQFKLIAGPTDQSAGIVFGLQPSGAYYFLRYNTKDGNLALWSYANGERQTIVKGEGLHQIPLGTWQELVVTIRDRAVSGSIVGIPVLSMRHELPAATTGRVGVWAKRDVVTAFRRFTVSP